MGMIDTGDLGPEALQEMFGDLDVSQQWSTEQHAFLAHLDSHDDSRFDDAAFMMCLTIMTEGHRGFITNPNHLLKR